MVSYNNVYLGRSFFQVKHLAHVELALTFAFCLKKNILKLGTTQKLHVIVDHLWRSGGICEISQRLRWRGLKTKLSSSSKEILQQIRQQSNQMERNWNLGKRERLLGIGQGFWASIGRQHLLLLFLLICKNKYFVVEKENVSTSSVCCSLQSFTNSESEASRRRTLIGRTDFTYPS